MFLSLSPSLPLSLKINKFKKRKEKETTERLSIKETQYQRLLFSKPQASAHRAHQLLLMQNTRKWAFAGEGGAWTGLAEALSYLGSSSVPWAAEEPNG